jgi:hypothetical protein
LKVKIASINKCTIIFSLAYRKYIHEMTSDKFQQQRGVVAGRGMCPLVLGGCMEAVVPLIAKKILDLSEAISDPRSIIK